ncbi:hypothetical protein M3Y97_00166100 [Aphelenchoides bicaudatus]|nr:hypothetical protein M3Y97_00166100 [Aphelenchoides bicaudatus]
MLHYVLFVSFIVLASSQQSGTHPTGTPPTGRPSHGHGPCGHHPHGPPKCPPEEFSKKGGKHHGPPPFGPLGPVGVIYCNLTETQRKEVDTIVESSFNKTKKELFSSLDSFVSGLSTDLQNAVATEKQQFEEMKKNVTEKVKSLSESAQTLFSQVEKIISDDSQTFPAEHDKIHKLIESTDKAVIREFIEAHIPLPGLCPPPHKPPHKKHHKH